VVGVVDLAEGNLGVQRTSLAGAAPQGSAPAVLWTQPQRHDNDIYGSCSRRENPATLSS